MLLASCTATISITHTECQLASVEKGAELKPIHGTTALPKPGGDTGQQLDRPQASETK
jgi:hypothetical protein